MSYINRGVQNELRTPPISNVAINHNIVSFKNANGKQKVALKSAIERKQFINWLLS